MEILARSIELGISDLQQHGDAHSDALQQTVNSMFVVDDKLFASLQKLGWELELEDPRDKEKESELREICARYVILELMRT